MRGVKGSTAASVAPNSAPAVREHGLIFTSESVCSILADTKVETRRLLTRSTVSVDGPGCSAKLWSELDLARAWVDRGPSPAGNPGPYLKAPRVYDGEETVHRVYPKWRVGDRIWGREKFRITDPDKADPNRWVVFAADSLMLEFDGFDKPTGRKDAAIIVEGFRWRSPLLMPRWAARLMLELTSVCIERLQDITEDAARAEGAQPEFEMSLADFVQKRPPMSTYRLGFKHGWNRINGHRPGASWDENPLVVVLGFKRIKQTRRA